MSKLWRRRIRPTQGSLATFFALSLFAGCVSSPPLETVGQDGGARAAYYEMDVKDRNWGDVRIWSRGIHSRRQVSKKPLVEFDVRVRNDSPEPLTLDLSRTELEVFIGGSEPDLVDKVLLHRGPTVCAPFATTRIRLVFPLPSDISNREVEGVELSWVLTTPDGPYSQSTVFRREERTNVSRPGVVYTTWQPWYVYGARGTYFRWR